MKSLTQFSIDHPLYTWLVMLACILGGVIGINTIGQLEDPPYPIKRAYIFTSYPGASAEEVEQEVTEIVETSLQELPYIRFMTSKSTAGQSEVMIELHQSVPKADTPQIWDEMRRRVAEAGSRLPSGTSEPHVEDDFADVYGIMYAVITPPGYSPGEISDIARTLETRLKLVPHVAKVHSDGLPQEAIFIEIDRQRMRRLGLPREAVLQGIGAENQVHPAGFMELGERRLRIASPMAFDSVESVANMRIGRPGSVEIIPVSDFATVTRGEVEQPPLIIHHQGQRAFTMGVSVVDTENVVEVGRKVDERVNELRELLPVGVEIVPVYRQHEVVAKSVDEFMVNLIASVVTVIATLCLFMGWRAGAVVGAVLLLTVLGTLGIMAYENISLQRISLGALMIAMGMLVDNAIVVAEGMITDVQRGKSSRDAAIRAVKRTQFPLLGATVIGIAAFAPIGLSTDSTGQFLGSLFQVVGISLLLSWFLAITVAPMLGAFLLRSSTVTTTTPENDEALYAGGGYRLYRKVLGVSLRRCWWVTLLMVSITLASLWGFGFVKQGFFPSNNTPLFYIDMFLPQGTDIRTTETEVERIEKMIRDDSDISTITTFVGRGPSRFMMIMIPEQPNSAYAHFVIRVNDVKNMNAVMDRIGKQISEAQLDTRFMLRRSEFSSSGSSKIEARFSGDDSHELRRLAEEVLDIYLKYNLIDRKTDWRNRELALRPEFDEVRARQAGVSRNDLAQELAFASNGLQIGLFRDQDKLLPIIVRSPKSERGDLNKLIDREIWSSSQQAYIPARQIISELTLTAQDSMIYRRDRLRTIIAQGNPAEGYTASQAFKLVRAEIENLPLPPGYSLEWGGEHEANEVANEALGAKIPLAFGVMILITLIMFGKIKQTLIIWVVVPMVVCGVVISLLATNLSFTFPSLLGLLSLTGMLLKNCIVLIDEIDKRLEQGPQNLDTILAASVSRMRPVLLAAVTTIAGMAPLLRDDFFREMAVCIMGGLAFASLLTLIAVPVFYAIAMRKQLVSDDKTHQNILT